MVGHPLSAGDACMVCGEDNATLNVDQPDGRTEWWCAQCANDEIRRLTYGRLSLWMRTTMTDQQ